MVEEGNGTKEYFVLRVRFEFIMHNVKFVEGKSGTVSGFYVSGMTAAREAICPYVRFLCGRDRP